MCIFTYVRRNCLLTTYDTVFLYIAELQPCLFAFLKKCFIFTVHYTVQGGGGGGGEYWQELCKFSKIWKSLDLQFLVWYLDSCCSHINPHSPLTLMSLHA